MRMFESIGTRVAGLEAVREHCARAGRVGRPVGARQLGGHHEPQPAHVAHTGVLRLERAQSLDEAVAASAGADHELLFEDHVDRRERGRASHRIRTVGTAVRAAVPAGHQLGAGADRQPEPDCPFDRALVQYRQRTG